MVWIADDALSFLSSAIIFTPRLQTWLSICPSSVNPAPALNWPVSLRKGEHLGHHFQSSDFPVQLELHSKSLARPTRPTWPLPAFLISPPTNFLVYHTLAALTSLLLRHAKLIPTSGPWHLMFPLPGLHLLQILEGLAPYHSSIFIVFIILKV